MFTVKKCARCAHYYRIMATASGYNPNPCCQVFEDSGTRPDFINQACFKARRRGKQWTTN